ncbi:ABC transporter permease [Microbacterium sp. LWO12-1.2]|uniref:ABC transporter permease n=1 Tax=Microbacterium sp. LWO12-1.2 TaxID=3135261 RepID=UPI0034422AA3
MLSFIARRTFSSLVVLLVASVLIFALTRMIPGDPVSMYFDPLNFVGDRDAAIAAKREELGLNDPLPVQYFAWLREALQGNLGISIRSGRPAGELILSRLPATLYLMGISTLIAIVVGVGGGILAALRKNTIWDYAVSFASLALISIPTFFFALLGIFIFGLTLHWLPTAGMGSPGGGWVDSLKYLVLPAGILGLAASAGYIRWARSSMLDVLNQEYMITAKSKGLRPGYITLRHGLPNAMIPLVTVIATSIPSLLGGAVIIETIFAWPGTGRLAVEALTNQDYPVIISFVMLTTVVVLLCNLVADVAYAAIDPRIKL